MNDFSGSYSKNLLKTLIWNETEKECCLFQDENTRILIIGKFLEGFDLWYQSTERGISGLIECLDKNYHPVTLIYSDKKKKHLYLFRDRFGEQPLYFSQRQEKIIFSSNIKGLMKVDSQFSLIPEFNNVVKSFFYNFTPCPATVFENIKEVEPGNYIEFCSGKIHIKKWYNPPQKAFQGSFEETLHHFDNLFCEGISVYSEPSETNGLLLSGGTDSSAVLAGLMKVGKKPEICIHTCFHEKKFSEESYAEMVSDYWKIPLEKFVLCPEHVNHFPEILVEYYQFGGDFSFLPFLMLGKKYQQSNLKLFCGDGGDELMAGYWYYKKAYQDELSGKDFSTEFGVFSLQELKHLFPEIQFDVKIPEFSSDKEIFLKELTEFDQKVLWPGNNLKKTSIMLGKSQLKVSSPLMYPPLVEFLNSLPMEFHMDEYGGKKILRKWLEKEYSKLAPNVWNRNKQMFTVPIGEWIKKDLRKLFECVLFQSEGFISQFCNVAEVRRLLEEHSQSRENNTRKLRILFSASLWWMLVQNQ